MTVTCIVQARMGSTRLPGKVAADLDGRPMLRYMLDRLALLPVRHLAVATSTLPRDDTVADIARAAGVDVVRGSESDVLDRFMTALDAFPAEHVIRLTGDCPFIDPKVVGGTLTQHLEREADYTCNVFPRTFPHGLDTEVASAAALRRAADEAVDPVEREHVMPYLYRHPEWFRLANHRLEDDLGRERWTVDTPEDLEFVRSVAEQLSHAPVFGWQDVLALTGRRWQPPAGDVYLRPARLADASLILEWRNDPATVAMSSTKAAVDPAGHAAWFSARLEDPATRIWIGELDGEPVGMVRIDVANAWGEVSVVVSPGQRGHGHGRRLLRGLLAETDADVQTIGLLAHIRAENASSRRIFEDVGFGFVGERDGLHEFRRTV